MKTLSILLSITTTNLEKKMKQIKTTKKTT